jgi:hypothetical protein
MRCGVQIQANQVFCEDCLATMEQYPIKPGTPVHLPLRAPAPDPKKAPKRKAEPTAEEQLTRARGLIRWMAAALAAALLALAVTGAVLVQELQEPNLPQRRNYSTNTYP